MGKSLTQRIIGTHLVSGRMVPGEEIGLRIDQTLTQDATGTMAYLQFEAMRLPRVRTKLSVSYVDHNMLQTGFENADDHRYLQSVAARYGIVFSRPGNGICHQVHLERFAVPGETLLGADSHTPTAGGLGMLAIGAGGLDVAVAMGGGPFYLPMPRVVHIVLEGRLTGWATAKDVIFEVLRRLTVRGGMGKVMEYAGPGVATLSVPERATITNMGAELGATTSIFPSDEQARRYLADQGREMLWEPLAADRDATYDEEIVIDLSALEPMVAAPSSPDNVMALSAVAGTKVAQVCVGSCTNSSYRDLMQVARILKGKTVHPDVNLTVTPGSKQVYSQIARSGALADLIAAGGRILEAGCGPCIGMGQAPPTGGVSVRSFNRNFPGRSGTPNDLVYLASPALCAVTALRGEFPDPRSLGDLPEVPTLPDGAPLEDNLLVAPGGEAEAAQVAIVRGPNIAPLPRRGPLEASVAGPVLLKLGDNITTDHIMPAGAKVLPLRSNVPAIAEHVFERVDPTFPKRARESGGGMLVGGTNYGQGSSREHAALAPMYLGVRAVLAKSFARIHRANLVNFGILPLLLDPPSGYDAIEAGDHLAIEDVRGQVRGGTAMKVMNRTKGTTIAARHDLTPREREVLLAGGLLNWTKEHAAA